jgi:dihydropteroate synthase
VNREQFYQWRLQAFNSTESPSNSFRQPLIMGVLNVTPDSFSDGGDYVDVQLAYDRAQEMIIGGVDVIDIGGESTKPGAIPVSTDEELDRVIPLIKRIRASSDVCISVDTYKVGVMQAAIESGVTLINDITALIDKSALNLVAQANIPVCLMHMKGHPVSMQENPLYTEDVVKEINAFFEQRIADCLDVGIRPEQLILDPGFGFGKSVSHNLQIVKRFCEFLYHGLPLLLGVSRKSTIGAVTNTAVLDRLPGSLATSVYALLHGASIIRTHDVSETFQALQMLNAIVNA